MALADGVSFQAAAAGTGSFTLGAARASFLTIVQAIAAGEIVDGQSGIPYLAQDSLSAPTQREWGHGTAHADGSFTRTTPLVTVNGSTVATGTPLNFSVAPFVSFTVLSEDLTLAALGGRTVLTGNLSLYVNASTGSDSYNGLLATFTGGVNGPKATLQNAFITAGGDYDYAAQYFATINAAAGSYIGFGVVPTNATIVYLVGAGSSLVTITDGPNDGIINSGECVGIDISGGIILQVQGVALEKFNADDTANIAIYVGGSTMVLAGDVKFISNNQVGFSEIVANSYLQIFQNAGSTFIEMNGKEYSGVLGGQFGAVIYDAGDWQISGTPDTLDNGFLVCESATYVSVSAAYTAATPPIGKRFSLTGGAKAFSHDGPGTLGLSYFPGTLAGTCDASSSYDDWLFGQPLSGAPTTSNIAAGEWGLFKDTTQATGSGVVLAYNDAGTIVGVGGGTPGGSSGDIQYNDGAGGFGANSTLSVATDGRILGPDGGIGSTQAAYAFQSDSTSGLYRNSTTGYLGFFQGNFKIVSWAYSAGFVISQSMGFKWSSVDLNSESSPDTGLARESAGVVKVTDGNSGYGAIDTNGYSASGAPGISVTITTAKITPVTGANGSMTFVNGILTAQTQAT